ncbi:hypothetical protein [Burkholderia plantarii]|uniref:hypothetical protein n=1 Tax=Burkholderia plantarii TaxID=41899 RepID=UPI0018DE2547|nr:hypothetical protein [Burkholderia plantarii]MBI0325715.1 hypothetical protein [Burkholderia plantarii]
MIDGMLIGQALRLVATSKVAPSRQKGRPDGPPCYYLPFNHGTITRSAWPIDPAAMRGWRDATDHG